MRLSKENADYFKKIVTEIDQNAKVYLFGSRADDNLKGGDIDILIVSDNNISISQINKIKTGFYKQFGERKIDIVCFSSSDESSFKQLALAEGVEL